jgi:uncharacterized protein (DUF2252 family)
MTALDPFTLAARQMEMDRESTARLPHLADRKKQRLAASPHAFLRGSSPLFYEILRARPDLAAGPAGDGWIVGDMHLENVGAYRDDADEVVFNLNDFDDATIAPLRFDVLRFSTGVLLAMRGKDITGPRSIAIVEHAIGAYLKARGGADAPPMPEPVRGLLSKVKNRDRKSLLDDRAPLDHGKRHFLRGERYLDLPADIAARVPTLLAAYLQALGSRAPGKASEWVIEDSAFRVAGNGSLGVVRVALLVRDRGGEERLIELKEERDASAHAVIQPPAGRWASPGERVALGARALLASPPRHLAGFAIDEGSFIGRRLFPQEDKLDLGRIDAADKLDELVQYIAHILGAAHARGVAALGASAPPPWNAADIAAIVDHAVELAGMHQGIYLAWSARNR